jgi:DNA polymerase III delta prime subunit
MDVQKGEVLLIKTSESFESRILFIKKIFPLTPDIVFINNKTISIDDIRDFKEDFQKTSQETSSDYKKLGILVFDDISINAQNSLLKIIEDIDKENCIILYTNKNIKLLSTVLSRVLEIAEVENFSKNEKGNEKIKEPNLEDKENIDKQEVIKWIENKIEKSKINKDKKPLIWINSPSPNIKYIVEYVNLFY